MKEILEEKQRKSDLKEKENHKRKISFKEKSKQGKKSPQKKRKIDDSTSSGSDEEVGKEDEESDIETNSSELLTFDALQKNPKKHDYVLVEFQLEKTTHPVYYVGKVLTDKDSNDEFEISFFRKSMKVNNAFIFPSAIDILISLSRIKMILPTPVLHGTTKRQQSFLQFGVCFSNIDIR